MSENQQGEEVAVDRRAETVVTQHPGYAATRQVTHDVAAERRMWSFQIDQIMWTGLGILEILLGLRFLLKLMAANPDSGFTVFIYGFTGLFVAPFTAILGTPTFGNSTFEVTTIFAMVIYALLFWVLMRVIKIAFIRPTARTVTNSTSERISGK